MNEAFRSGLDHLAESVAEVKPKLRGWLHLGTAPPEQQLAWLEYLHERGCAAQLSADMFEHYATSYRVEVSDERPQAPEVFHVIGG